MDYVFCCAHAFVSADIGPMLKRCECKELWDHLVGCMQHAIGFMLGGVYYGAKATINVWRSDVEVPSEFSLSQIWILGGAFNSGLNTIEAGWQVPHPLLVQRWNMLWKNLLIFMCWLVSWYYPSYFNEVKRSPGPLTLLCSHWIEGFMLSSWLFLNKNAFFHRIETWKRICCRWVRSYMVTTIPGYSHTGRCVFCQLLKKKVSIYFSDLSCVRECKLLKQGDVSAEDQEAGRKLGTRVIVNKVLWAHSVLNHRFSVVHLRSVQVTLQYWTESILQF